MSPRRRKRRKMQYLRGGKPWTGRHHSTARRQNRRERQAMRRHTPLTTDD